VGLGGGGFWVVGFFLGFLVFFFFLVCLGGLGWGVFFFGVFVFGVGCWGLVVLFLGWVGVFWGLVCFWGVGGVRGSPKDEVGENPFPRFRYP